MSQMSRQAILDAVHKLPPEEQVALAEEILETASKDARREPPPAPTAGSAMALRGIMQTEIPLNEQQLLEESRQERYG